MKKINCQKNSAYLITDRLLRKYFCDYDVAEGFLVIRNEERVLFTDARYFLAVKEALIDSELQTLLFNGLSDIEKYLKDNKISTIYLDYTTTTMAEYEQYKSFGIEIKNGRSEIDNVRSVKSEEEIGYIKKACYIAQKAYHEGIKTVKEGITENQLKDETERLMKEYGAQCPSFETIVAFGKNSAVPHHETGETKLKKDMPILVDMGCMYNGYASDMTRMAYFGNPDSKFLDCYNAVLTANEKAIREIRENDSVCFADSIARNYLKERGLDKFFTHSLGHGVGIEIHEHPFLSPRKNDILKNNMVFTIEPGVYLDGEFGIRIEDTVLMKEGKVERLFDDSKKLNIIEVK